MVSSTSQVQSPNILKKNDGAEKIGFKNSLALAVSRTVADKLSEKVSVKDFGAVGDGITNDTAAIMAAWGASKKIFFPSGTYYAPGLELNGGGTYTQKSIVGDGAIITGDDHYITALFGCIIKGITFASSGYLYIQGLRYCTISDFITNDVKWGKYTNTGASSWSTYWNNLTQCKFKECEYTLSLTDANFNSNTFTVCEWRGSSTNTSLGALWTFKDDARKNAPFVGNTYIGCDMSYLPVINMVNEYAFSSITVIGGYIDTGTPWYHPDSFKFKDITVLGIRNPSGVTLDENPGADLYLTNGGGTPRKQLPVSALSLFRTNPTKVDGTTNTVVKSVPLPHDGAYTISGIFKDNAGNGFGATKFTNTTTNTEKFGVFSSAEGVSTYTFNASQGDEIELLIDGASGADVDILALSLCAGAGNYFAIPYTKLYELPENKSTVTVNNGGSEDLVGIDVAPYSKGFYDVVVVSNNPVTAGGTEKITLELAFSAGGASVAVDLKELRRVSVDGVGGASDNIGTLTVTHSVSGLGITLTGALSGLGGGAVTVQTKIKLYE